MHLRRVGPILWCLSALWLTACGGHSEENTAAGGPRATFITTTSPTLEAVEVTERSVGRLEPVAAPVVAAEVPGRVTAVSVDIGDAVAQGQELARIDSTDYTLQRGATGNELARLQALQGNQRKLVQRYRQLSGDGFVSQTALDEAEAQLRALEAQVQEARSRLAIAERNVGKSVIEAPVTGVVEQRMISEGDFVAAGTPAFQIADNRRVRVHLPFPETVADRLRPGLPVRLVMPLAPEQEVETTIDSLRPLVGSANRAIEAIVEIDTPQGWKPGASVSAVVVLERRADALTVPHTSIVARPAGTVIYVVRDATAHAVPVEVGERKESRTVIHGEVDASTTVVVDGAGFLTDGAPVRERETS